MNMLPEEQHKLFLLPCLPQNCHHRGAQSIARHLSCTHETVAVSGLVKHCWVMQGYLAAMSASSYSYVSMLQHFGPLLRPNGAAVSLTYIASERTIPGPSLHTTRSISASNL